MAIVPLGWYEPASATRTMTSRSTCSGWIRLSREHYGCWKDLNMRSFPSLNLLNSFASHLSTENSLLLSPPVKTHHETRSGICSGNSLASNGYVADPKLAHQFLFTNDNPPSQIPHCSPEQINRTLDALDSKYICNDKAKNVILRTDKGVVGYRNGYVAILPFDSAAKNDPSSLPTWTISPDKQSGGYSIGSTDPFGRTTWWSGGYGGQLQVTNYDNYRFFLRILSGREPKLVAGWGNDQCLWFGDANVARMSSQSVCEPMTIDVPRVAKEWWDPLNDPRPCTAEFIPAAAREIQDALQRGGEVEAQGAIARFVEKVAPGYGKFFEGI